MKVVLFADNDRDFLETRSEFLEAEGYTVLKAFSPQQAWDLLERKRVHLAILDIRLTNDAEGDISGLELAQEPAYRSLPKIMLTGFPNVEAVRAALRPVVGELPPAVDYLSKKGGAGKKGAEVLVEAVQRAFEQYVRLNWDLHVHWGEQRERLSFLHLASLLQPDLPNEILVQRAEELQDLVRHSFYDYQHVRFDRLLWDDGGRVCLSVLAQSPLGATDARLFVCGQRDLLAQELERTRELAPMTLQGIKVAHTTETIHFCAVTYVLPSADVETMLSLRELFKSGRERSLKTALDHVLKEVLATWHRRGQKVEQGQDLMALYRHWVGLELSQTEVERRIEALVQATRPLSAVEVERGDGLVVFRFPAQEPLACPDPVETVYALLEQHDQPVVCKISPGWLTADNVLVDADGGVWLTDFAHAAQAPQCWDFVCLEAILRFDLSQAPDLLAWQEFEECLVTPDRLYDRLPVQDVPPELRTNVGLIEQIRRQAGSETGPDPLPYYAGLLAWAVGAMARYDPAAFYTQAEQMRGAHLLLAAAMLAGRLAETFSAPPSRPGGVLRLDEDGTLWNGADRIGDLWGQELALLRLLFERPGQILSRQTIVEAVFDEPYQAGDEHLESRINSLVRRLRIKIEPDPNHPRYVLTAKGKGYRLQAGGKT
jgi:DNA-binding response OmpR family regulator